MRFFLYLLPSLFVYSLCLASETCPEGPQRVCTLKTEQGEEITLRWEGVVNLQKPCGFNLEDVLKYERLVRNGSDRQINGVPAGVNEAPFAAIVNHATILQDYPEVRKLSRDDLESINKAFLRKKDVEQSLKQSQDKEKKKLSKKLSEEIKEFNKLVENKMPEAIKIIKDKGFIESKDLISSTAGSIVASFMSGVNRILDDFSVHKITEEHIWNIPPRNDVQWGVKGPTEGKSVEEAPAEEEAKKVRLNGRGRTRVMSLAEAKTLSPEEVKKQIEHHYKGECSQTSLPSSPLLRISPKGDSKTK